MWFSASLSVSPSAMLWWSLLQRMKAMMRVRSESEKSNTCSMKRRVASTSWLLSTAWARRTGRSFVFARVGVLRVAVHQAEDAAVGVGHRDGRAATGLQHGTDGLQHAAAR